MPSFQQLRRSTTDRKVSGLCGGVARQWGIDPLLVRVLAVLLAVSGGMGLVLYLVGWLLVPEEGHDDALFERWVPQSKSWPREVWIVATVVIGIACVTTLGSVAPVGLAPALIVLAVWYFGFRHRGPAGRDHGEQGATPPPPPARVHDPLAGPPTPFTQAARQWQARVAEHQRRAGQAPGTVPAADRSGPRSIQHARPRDPADSSAFATGGMPGDSATQTGPGEPGPATPDGGPSATATAPQPGPSTTTSAPTWAMDPATPTPQPTAGDPFFQLADPAGLYTEPAPVTTTGAPRARRIGSTPAARRLRWGILLVALLAMAGLGVADAVGVTVPWVLYPATALLIVGLGLVIATWVGRGRGLLAVGIILLIATPLTQLGSEAADRIPTQWASQTVAYQTQPGLPPSSSFAGGDYTVDLSDLKVTTSQTYDVNVQMGSLRVQLPRDARVVVHASTSWGAVELPDQQAGGNAIRRDGTYGPTDPGAPTLTINASVDVGSLEVVR